MAHSCESFFKVGQKYLNRKSFSVRDCPVAWFPHKPSWTSQSAFFSSPSFRNHRSGIEYPLLSRISSFIVYLIAKLFSFLISSLSSGTVPRLRYSIRRVIHEGGSVSPTPLRLLLRNTSLGTLSSHSSSMPDARRAKASASALASWVRNLYDFEL